MTPSDDHSPPRRPIFFPVVIATVFLTIIGMTVGFVLGERHRREVSAGETPGTQTTTQVGGVPSVDSRPLCPEVTLQTAQRLGFSSTLRQVMKIATVNGTTVWICQDDTGGYYYQGKTGGPDSALVEGKNGLFLSNVRHAEDREEYVAIADDGSRIVVSRKQLEVHRAKDGQTQISEVVESD